MPTNIAFLCLAHTNFDYLEEVSNYYNSGNDKLFLHIDTKSNSSILKNLHPDTVLIPEKDSFRTRWGTIEIVYATLKLLQMAYAQNKYQRFILISGADVPLLTKFELKEKLAKDRSYLSIWSEASSTKKTSVNGEFFKKHFYYTRYTNLGEAFTSKSRIRIHLALILKKLISLIPVKDSFTFDKYYKGSQWWCLTDELTNYLLSELKHAKILQQFNQMHAPDEKVIHSILMNSPYANKIEVTQGQATLRQALHYIDWGYSAETISVQEFSIEKLNTAKALGCTFARKIAPNNIGSYVSHVQSLTNRQ